MISSYFNHHPILSINWLLIVILVLSGCSGFTSKQKPAPVSRSSTWQKPASSYNPVIQTTPYIEEQAIEAVPLQEQDEVQPFAPSMPQTTPAVLALMDDADRSYLAGNYQSAVGSIERALRIEPRNPLLVYKLAAVRLKQGQPGLAENLAKKSALLADRNIAIKRRSWLLIAEARRKQGDHYGAAEAEKTAGQF